MTLMVPPAATRLRPCGPLPRFEQRNNDGAVVRRVLEVDVRLGRVRLERTEREPIADRVVVVGDGGMELAGARCRERGHLLVAGECLVELPTTSVRSGDGSHAHQHRCGRDSERELEMKTFMLSSSSSGTAVGCVPVGTVDGCLRRAGRSPVVASVWGRMMRLSSNVM
jgi:hypothetical protein